MNYKRLQKQLLVLTIGGLLLFAGVRIHAEETAELMIEKVETFAEGDIPVDEEHFPDDAFREYVKKECQGEDGILTKEERMSIFRILFFGKEYTDLTGIEYFPNLKDIDVGDASIKRVDLSKNVELERVSFLSCNITEIIGLEKLSKLKFLNCYDNSIRNLDISKNLELEGVYCVENELETLDTSNNLKLQDIECGSNHIVNMTVDKNPELTFLCCQNNKLTSLDVSQNTKLIELRCDNNYLKNIDISNNPMLRSVACRENEIEKLDLSNNPQILMLFCEKNHIMYLDLRDKEEILGLEAGSQTAAADARKNNGKWEISLAESRKDIDFSRINVLTEGCSYDTETGKITLPDKKLEKIIYSCKVTDKIGDYIETDMKVELDINYKEDTSEEFPFGDVPASAWYSGYVKYVYENNLMTGLKNDIFGPAESLARAQFATILYRMEGEPEVEYNNKFPDVGAGIWYTDPILWASEAGIVNGYTDTGLFGPGDKINREQMAVMMYRYAKYMKYDTSQKTDFSKFQDAASVNEFAKEAMQWAVGSGIITGAEGGIKLNPQGNANRAECATIIMRFSEKYGKPE